ncbi:Odorant receptor 255 [Nylanderia fulva]|uniref:Odorant receptor n=1 Tax=Nylanderia fulva TaxID=613905 RepID=A0A6G1LP59_9HYME|nr:odorant receptor 4-like [Nylanderia fulva]KAF3054241.1 Odorant receptor 255 [Nylanderia fulva]
MFCIETEHFNLNRILLLSIGLWPYKRSIFVRLQGILFFSILSSFVILQLITLTIKKCTFDFFVKVCCTTIFFSIFAITYNMFWINTHSVKNLLDQLQYICNELKNEKEIAIITKYGNNAKRCTTIITSFATCSTFIATLLPVWPQILHIVLHKNESQSRPTIQLVPEYFDQEKYFYLLVFHINTVICIGAITATATATMLLGWIIYICGLFRVVSYRIEQAMTIEVLRNIHLENETVIYKEISDAIEIHCKTIKFSEFFSSTFQGSFFILISIGVISLSMNFFGVFQNLGQGNTESLILHIIGITVILIYMFIANYAGQEVTNHNNHIYFTAYNSRWYVAPLHAQKMLLFILQRSNKNFYINIGGIIAISLECFAALTKLSMSYFTVMYSMHE